MLQLDFIICQKGDCSVIDFSETTGLYNVTSNPTGWGTSVTTVNPDIALYKYSKLEFFNSAGTLVKTFELYPDFPTFDTAFKKSLTIDFPDGIYRIVYTVKEDKNSSTSYTKEIQQAFLCNVQCCVKSMVKNIDFDCKCSDKASDEYIKAFVLLQGLICAANCGNISQFNNILGVLEKICKAKKCNCKCK